MAELVPAVLKAIKPYLARASELDAQASSAAPAAAGPLRVVAYFCRQHALTTGMRAAGADEAAAGYLLGLMDTLEAEKARHGDAVSVGDAGRDAVVAFAADVFARADAEDRAGLGDRNTAKLFLYVA